MLLTPAELNVSILTVGMTAWLASQSGGTPLSHSAPWSVHQCLAALVCSKSLQRIALSLPVANEGCSFDPTKVIDLSQGPMCQDNLEM